MNEELREATMLIYDEANELEAVYVFKDHHDAVNIWDDLKAAGKTFYMGAIPVTHFAQGEKPDLLFQQKLF